MTRVLVSLVKKNITYPFSVLLNTLLLLTELFTFKEAILSLRDLNIQFPAMKHECEQTSKRGRGSFSCRWIEGEANIKPKCKACNSYLTVSEFLTVKLVHVF